MKSKTGSSSGSAERSLAFPTEAREKEQLRRAEGHKPKKQQAPVEEHYDDLGDDLSGLGSDLAWYAADTIIEMCTIRFCFVFLFK